MVGSLGCVAGSLVAFSAKVDPGSAEKMPPVRGDFRRETRYPHHTIATARAMMRAANRPASGGRKET